MTIESIVNQALDRIGYKKHLGNIWDGSPPARIALNAWGDTRDTLFTMLQPDWSRWDDPLTPSKTAPPWYDEQTPWDSDLHPDMPWRFEYALPELCLVPLALKPRPAYLPVWRPRPMRWRIKAEGGAYTMLGNDPAPVMTSVHSVHDVDLWHNDFIEAMVETLAKRLAPLTGGPAKEPERKGDANDAR